MGSLEKELGLYDVQSESSYFDYVEQKLTSGSAVRTKVVESNKQAPKRAEITEDAKFWKEFASS